MEKTRPGAHSVSRKWLTDQGFMLQGRKHNNKRKGSAKAPQSRRPYNVLMMDGGQANVPSDQWMEFLQCCAYDMNLNVATFYTEVELNPETPRALASDLDYIMAEGYPAWEQTLQHILCMHATVNRFMPEGKNEGIVLQSPPKQTTRVVNGERRVVFKVGVHIVWPECVVTQENSLRVRASWLNDLELAFGRPGNLDNSWASIVDENIYRTGLRLPGSAKCERCKKCNNDEAARAVCDACYNEGRLYDLSNVYDPKWTISPKGEVSPSDFHDSLAVLSRCCLRKVKGVLRSDFRVPLGAPEVVLPANSGRCKTKKLVDFSDGKYEEAKRSHVGCEDKKKPAHYDFQEDRQSMARMKQFRVQFDLRSPEAQAIISFIHEALPKVYEQIVIRDVLTNKNRTYFIASTNSSYCQNYQRNHNSNTIYFYISAKDGQIYQKCHCTCATTEGRISGKECRYYMSAGIRLPFDLIALLFPGRHAKRKGGNSLRRNLPNPLPAGGASVCSTAHNVLDVCAKALGGRPPGRVMDTVRPLHI